MSHNNGTSHSLPGVSAGNRKNEFPPFFFVPSDDGRIPIRLYLRIIWNRRWIILAGTLAIVIAVGIKTVKQKPVYKAKGTLEIELPKQSVTTIQDFFSPVSVPDSYLQTQAKIMNSGQIARQVMDEVYPPNPPKPATADARWTEELSFQKRLDVQVLKGSQLIQVSFESEDPGVAAKVVNRLMSRYIDQIQALRSEAATGASSWLMDRATEAKAKLDQSMEALRSFERDHQLVQVDPDRERLMNVDAERLEELQKQLAAIETTKMEKESILKRLQDGDTQAVQSNLLEDNRKKETELETQLAKLSNKFGPNFPEVQHVEAQLAEVRSIVVNEQDRLSKEVEAEYQAQTNEEALTRREIELVRAKLTGGSDQVMRDSILKHDVDLNEQAYESLLQKLQEATNTASLKTANARVVDPAEPPAISSYPGLIRNLLFSLVLGLVGGVVYSIAEELLRDTIKTAGEAEADLELPLLGIVPAVSRAPFPAKTPGDRNGHRVGRPLFRANQKPGFGEWLRLDRDDDEHYELDEAIRNLRTSLLFAIEGKGCQAIQFSSTIPSEGKTTISSNVSISLTHLGKRVLMIDGDLRRPCLHKVFCVSERKGLSEYLSGGCEWREVAYPTGVSGLDVIVCGERPQNPAELLSSTRMRQLIEEAKRRYDIVVVDSPTLLSMADSRILASYVDEVVLVLKSRATPRFLARQAVANVRSADAAIMGIVLNHLEIGDTEYSYEYYGYPKPIPTDDHDREHVGHV